MIGYLSGKILFKEENSVIVEAGGVGWEVYVPLFLWQNFTKDDEISLHIYTHVREDEIRLFGFSAKANKQVFLSLISVSGIGPKLALNVLSQSKGSGAIVKAIEKADVEFFSSIKGLGKKGSQRIIVDLKPKIGGIADLEFESEQDADLLEALKGLGFSGEEIKKATKGIKKELSLEEKIKKALKKQDN